MIRISILMILLAGIHSSAGEIASTKNTGSSRDTKAAPGATLAANLGNCRPALQQSEASARKHAETAGLSKEEILARLIYSESLSSGYWNGRCNAKSADDIMTSIGWGIMNRVKGKASATLDAYSDVIFAPKQFATSFSSSKPNPFAEAFLCPLESDKYLQAAVKKDKASDLYKKSQKIASEIISEYERDGLPQSHKGITNFFYPQSEYFGELRPKWAPDKDAKKNKGYINLLGVNDNPCVEFYRLK